MDNHATPGVPRGAAWRLSFNSGRYYLPAYLLDPLHDDCAPYDNVGGAGPVLAVAGPLATLRAAQRSGRLHAATDGSQTIVREPTARGFPARGCPHTDRERRYRRRTHDTGPGAGSVPAQSRRTVPARRAAVEHHRCSGRPISTGLKWGDVFATVPETRAGGHRSTVPYVRGRGGRMEYSGITPRGRLMSGGLVQKRTVWDNRRRSAHPRPIGP
jgi:hypothetical protein